MIPREQIIILLLTTVLLIIEAQNARSYDANDWIPITDKCTSCSPEKNQAVVEKKPTGRVLNLPEVKRNHFFAEDYLVRTKKSNNNQYLRELTPPVNPSPRQPEFKPLSAVQPQNNFQSHLNQGEFINQYLRQPNFQQREQPRHPPLLFQQSPQGMQFAFPIANPQFSYRQQFAHSALLNNPAMQQSSAAFQQNYQRAPFGYQDQSIVNFINNKSNSFESLNPGIQAINQGLSGDILATSNNNFRDVPLRTSSVKPTPVADSVQLLYVPIDSLNQKQQPLHSQSIKQENVFLPNTQFNKQDFNRQSLNRQPQDVIYQQQQFSDNVGKTQPLTQFLNHGTTHKQQQLLSIQQDFAQQALDALNLQLQLQSGQIPSVVHQPPPTTTTTTTVPTTVTQFVSQKPKPHQPPLAVYMGGVGDITVTDVLSLLKNAKTISVQDVVGPDSPQVFVGPHNLEAPEGYVKFDLPYLSALGSNRIERKVDQFPFFVAPLSYKAPPGYSKIPLPAPHVGSVVISQKDRQLQNQDQKQSVTLPTGLSEDRYQFLHQPSNVIQPFRFENPVNEGLHRFNNPVQSSSTVSPTQRYTVTTQPSFLKQTINEYELEQINNQFLPQSQTEFQEENGSNEHEDGHSFQQPKVFKHNRVTTTRPGIIQRVHFQPNEYSGVPRFRQFTTNRFASSTSPPTTTQFVPPPEVEATTRLTELHPDLPSRIQQETFSNHKNQDEYTILEQFPVKSKTPLSSTEAPLEVDLNPPPIPTANFPNHQGNFRPILQPITENQFLPPQVSSQPPLTQTNNNNQFDYQKQISHSHAHHQIKGNSRPIPQPITENQFLPPQVTSQPPLTQTNNNNQFDYQQQISHHAQHQIKGNFRPIPQPITENQFLPSQVSSQPPLTQTNNNNQFDYQQQISHSHTQHQINQFSNQEVEQKPTQTLPTQIINGPLMEPAYLQLNENGQYVPVHSNHHISHKIVQQPFQDVATAASTEATKQIQQFTEQAPFENTHDNLRTGTEKTQFVSDFSSEIVEENDAAKDNYKLPTKLPSIHSGIHTLINDLQDQAIRPLLVPASIAPKNEAFVRSQLQHQQFVEVPSTEPYFLTTTLPPPPITYSSTTEAPTVSTTPYRRQRGRQRFKLTTTTYAPQRITSRTRRPTYRTTTEQLNYQQGHVDEYTEYSPTKSSRDYPRVRGHREEVASSEITQRPVSRQRLRTRVRTTEQPHTIEQSTVSHEHNFRQPQFQSGFQGSKLNPALYMQFEHEGVPNLHNRAEHYITSEEPQILTKETPFDHRMNIDVHIPHPIAENVNREPLIISEPEGDSHYVRYSSNLDTSSIVTHKQEETTTSSSYVRINARGRLKSRTTSTAKPTTTTAPLTTTVKEREEFYGFFRPPHFNAPQQQFYVSPQVSTTRRPVYISNNVVQYEDQPVDNSNNVDIYSKNYVVSPSSPGFIGELITKYTPTVVTTTEPSTTQSLVTTRNRIRGRMRVPVRKYNDSQKAYVAPSSEPRLRSRGKSHFKVSNKEDNKSDDEDVEGGNYPKIFPKTQVKTERPPFQITIEPAVAEPENDEDQVPYSSIHRPKVVLAENTDSAEATDRPILNDIPIDRKIIESQEQPVALPVVSDINSEFNTEATDTKKIMDEIISEIDKVNDEVENITSKPIDDVKTGSEEKQVNASLKSRRRGVWRLVKRPVESFETAESQYIGKISANSLTSDDNKKNVYASESYTITEANTKPSNIEITTIQEEKETTPSPSVLSSTTEETFLGTFYKMFGMEDGYEQPDSSKTEFSTESEHVNEVTTKQEDLIEPQTEQMFAVSDIKETTIVPYVQNSTEATTQIDIKHDSALYTTEPIATDSLEANSNTQTEPWDLIRTSTVTEISHETEICYRGKCIKSSGTKTPNE